MTRLPATVPKDAPLPQTYEQAKNALAECERVDECKDWSDKAQALASYAKQADDDSLFKMARRIQARAVRRTGQLLKQFQVENGVGRPPETTVGSVSENGAGTQPISQREAAERAGMSKHQEKQARRVAEVPEQEFEEQVESEDPPSITRLAGPKKTSGFKEATHVLGELDRFSEFCREHEPESVASGVLDSEAEEARRYVSIIDHWLDRFVVNIGEG